MEIVVEQSRNGNVHKFLEDLYESQKKELAGNGIVTNACADSGSARDLPV